MPTARRPRKILVVDDDEVLLLVLSRVLTAAGHELHRATTVAEALQQADGDPEAVLLDLCLPEGDGVELARALHTRHPGLPLILMTANPTRLREHPDLAREFAHVLTKPMDLHQLQQILNDVLPEESMNQPTPTPKVESVVTPAAPTSYPDHSHHDLPEARRHASRFFKAMQSAGLLLIVAVVLVIFLGFVLGVRLPGMAATAEDIKIEAPPRLGVALVKDQPHTLLVPEEVRRALGIRKGGKDLVEVVKVPTATRPLNLYGSTALDPTRLVRIRARFAPAEVVQIGHGRDPVKSAETGRSVFRELRPGDRVQKGDVLGVFFSVDVGSKKNDLLDALVQYELDQKIHENMTQKSSAIPEVMLLNQWRNVQSDRNAINRALNNLKVWNIPQEEIDALHEEAKKISGDKNAWFRTPEGRWVKGEKQGTTGHDPDKENDNPWGKVTLRAPFDGIIVERNITVHEIVQDPTVNLFQIAQVNRLLVIANAPEDELPTLNALMNNPKREGPVRWSVRTVGPVPVTGLKGPIEEIGYLIDPNQHTAIVKGYIDNPDEQIRAGQFVSCTIQVPPPEDVVEVPIDAVVEDGKYCVAFVQTDPAKHQYTMRRVQLTHRFEKTAFVRGKPFAENERLTAEEKELGLLPLEPLRPGERILKTGVGELKAALLDLESRPARSAKASESTIARQDAAKEKK
jgi:cobalt-zinc-cadmium efflux system membrane fusion protein